MRQHTTDNRHWINFINLKNIVIFLSILTNLNLNGQNIIEKQLGLMNKGEILIANSLNSYSLSQENNNEVKKNFENESEVFNLFFVEDFFGSTQVDKSKSLNKESFDSKFKEKSIYVDKKSDNKSILQACTDGGFETWPVSGNQWIFKQASVALSGPNINTTSALFTPFSVGSTVNNFNVTTHATLVSPGSDPIISAVSRVNNGQRAIKLNFAQLDNGAVNNVVTMSRNITINEGFYDFSYSVILNNPQATDPHPVENKPFFLVRIYDMNNNILRSVNVLTNPGDCTLTSTTRSGYDGTILYSGWRCGRINTSSLIGQNVRVDFVVADCLGGRHFGTVYIDDVCSSSCSNPLFGSVDLNNIPTSVCPTTSQTVCGTYQLPLQSQYSSMLLNVTQNGNIVGTVSAPSSIDQNTRSFCFNVPISAFGANPTGNFEYQVVVRFNRLCTVNFLLDPIFDYSANDTGPDVVFNGPITPTFNQVSAVCSGTTLSALPTTSTNGIIGSWSPSINTSATTTYTFTPNPGQCAIPTTMTISVNVRVTPTFTSVAPICKGSALTPLPTLSNNGITGTWSPALNNMSTTTYTFTPSTGLCANTTTMTIVVIPIVAVNDDFSLAPINTLLGGTTSTVFTNDTLNGLQVNSTSVLASIVSVTPLITPTPTISASGMISIPQGTAIGTYQIVYKIIQNGCAANFTTATSTIVVSEQVIPTPQIVPGIRADNIVTLVDTQSDGKIIIAGNFNNYNNLSCLNINRLNTDLTYDTNTGFVVSGPTPAMSVPMDMEVIKTPGADYNKILLVGSFTGFSGGSNGKGIIRLNANGSVDNSFNVAYSGTNPGVSGSNSQIRTVFVFPTGPPLAGKILIGGMFSFYNNNPANKLALLNADGSFNTSGFNTQINTVTGPILGALPGFTSSPQTIGIQSDGKIIIGGYFNQYNGWSKLNIVRLNIDGSLDNSFNSLYTGANPGILPNINFGPYVNKLVVQPDNKIILAGQFTHYNNISSNNLARLNANGTMDTTFAIGSGFNNGVINQTTATKGLVRDIILDTGSSNWKLYACGDFTAYQGVACDEIIRINCSISPGSNDINGFSLNGGGPNGNNNGPVWSIKKQIDGKIIVGGKFTTYSLFSALNLTRIFPANPSNELRTGNVFYESEPEIDILSITEVVVYPNPSTGLVTFKMPYLDVQKYKCKVYNLLGQKMMEQNDVVNNTSLDLSHLPKGSYIISLSSLNTKITKTILIK